MRTTRLLALTVALSCLGVGAIPAHAQETRSDTEGQEPAADRVSAYEWVEQSPALSPPGLSRGGMTYDAAVGKIILFGGAGSPTDDTWAWDGETWSVIADTGPTPRAALAMAYDPIREETVLFGGLDYGDYPLNDTWVFKDGAWKLLDPPTSPPDTREHTMAFDPELGKIVVFGGLSSGGFYAWDGTTWARVDARQTPSPRYRTRLIEDPTRDRLVLFGGRGSADLDDTWRWTGRTWAEESPSRSPSARDGHVMSRFGRHIVLFGGDGEDDTALRDTWLLVKKTWKRVRTDTSPPALTRAMSAWDPVRKELVLFGGSVDDEGAPHSRETWVLQRR